MNHSSTLAKYFALASFILIITFNTQAQSSFSEAKIENCAIVNLPVNFYSQQENVTGSNLVNSKFESVYLPVKYLLFEGKLTEKSLLLNWTTTEEINNNYFQVERSFNGTDFIQIGLALDGFENGTKKEYAFKDYSDLIKKNETIYYRLRQIDNDGNFSLSKNLIVNGKGK